MTTRTCSFCGKKQGEVMALVAAPQALVCICDECSMLAVEMISVQHPDWREHLVRTLDLLPKHPGQTTT